LLMGCCEQIFSINWQNLDRLSEKIKYTRYVIALTNPIKVLQRGVVLARSAQGLVLTSKTEALQAFKIDQTLTFSFYDGDIKVSEIK